VGFHIEIRNLLSKQKSGNSRRINNKYCFGCFIFIYYNYKTFCKHLKPFSWF